MALLAALDLGTNSAHLVVARVSASGAIDVVTRHKEVVRLGHGGGDMKLLEPEAIERGLGALARMRRLAESAGAPLRTVATSAVREADNAAPFIERARDEAGVEIEVISGVEEARLIHLGVIQAVPAGGQRVLGCDIGGGSTEIYVGEAGEMLAARSFKLGAVRLTDRFFPGGEITPKALRACRAFVRSSLSTFEREVRSLRPQRVAGSSGTIEAVAHLVHAASGGEPLHTYNCFIIGRAELDEVVTRLVRARSSATRATLAGMEPERADIIVAGALILEAVFDVFGAGQMTVSENALREGVLLDTMMRTHGGDADIHHLLVGDVARRSVEHLAELCDDDPQHSAHVAALAAELFDATASWHGLEPRWRGYLHAAALLANVGLVIAHSKHHLHSYYVIRNSEQLTGFTDHEIELIALIARYHRKSAPKASHSEFARLSATDQHVVRVLAGLLRVAIGLDRSHDGRVERIEIAAAQGNGRRKTPVTIVAIAHGGADLALEVYAANERRGLLEEVLGRPVVVIGS